jgi:hypothetical protein
VAAERFVTRQGHFEHVGPRGSGQHRADYPGGGAPEGMRPGRPQPRGTGIQPGDSRRREHVDSFTAVEAGGVPRHDDVVRRPADHEQRDVAGSHFRLERHQRDDRAAQRLRRGAEDAGARQTELVHGAVDDRLLDRSRADERRVIVQPHQTTNQAEPFFTAPIARGRGAVGQHHHGGADDRRLVAGPQDGGIVAVHWSGLGDVEGLALRHARGLVHDHDSPRNSGSGELARGGRGNLSRTKHDDGHVRHCNKL